MKSFLKLSFISVIVLFFSSCGKKNEVGKMIPDNAMFVAQVNLKSLGNKLSWKEIQQTDIYKKAISDSSMEEWRKKLLEDPSGSGIDFDEGLIFFTADHNGNKYFAVEGKIKNTGDFDQFNKNFSDGAATKDGDISLLNLKDNGVVGRDNAHFVYLMNPESKMVDMGKWKDRLNLPKNNAPADRSVEFSDLCKKLFSLKTDSSLAKNDKFASLLKETGDIHIYQNTDAMINNSPAMGMLGMLKLDAFTKGNSSTYTINFDNGKIDVSQKLFVSKELTDIVKKYMGNSIDMDMIKKIPSNNVIGLLASNFKPEGITEMIKLTGVDGMINSYTQPMGFNLDDFSKATNGKWLLASTDLNISDSMHHPEFNYIFAAGIDNKASLQKMLDAAKKTTSQMGKDSLVNYVMNDKLFAQSNHTSFANQYLNGNSNTSFNFADKISGHPVAFYFDIHKLLSQFSSWNMSKPGRKEMLDKSLDTWNNIISTGGEFNKGGFIFNTEVNLVNKDRNSLQQLSNYLNQLFLIHEKEKTETSNSTALPDSLLVPPPADTIK
ncbi:MAG: DUF4836 family protein [Bacteroidota bacterium]|nr:DUF4836 family protein [Bacteroidota bacterium]